MARKERRDVRGRETSSKAFRVSFSGSRRVCDVCEKRKTEKRREEQSQG